MTVLELILVIEIYVMFILVIDALMILTARKTKRDQPGSAVPDHDQHR